MSEKIKKITKDRVLAAVLLVVIAIGSLVIWGCGSSSYDDPVAASKAQYYANDATVNTLIEPAALKAWIDNGNKTEAGKPVVILDITNGATDNLSWFAGNASLIKQDTTVSAATLNAIDDWDKKGYLGHIPGALWHYSHGGLETAVRSDGPMNTDHEVGTGGNISQMLQTYGITKNTVIVLTSSRNDGAPYCPTRLWWTLYYWGFTKENLRILNGSTVAYAQAGYPLQKGGTTQSAPPSSTFDVADLPGRHFDARIAIGELIQLVDSGRTSLPMTDPNKVVLIDGRQPPVAYYFNGIDKDTGTGVPNIYNAPYYNTVTKKFMVSGADSSYNLSQMLFNAATNSGTARVPFVGTNNPPIALPDINIPQLLGLLTPTGPALTGGSTLQIPLGAKARNFDGIIKGSVVTKGNYNGVAFNITVASITNAVTTGLSGIFPGIASPTMTIPGAYKTKAQLLPIFAAAGIDGTKPIILYCNSGAVASIYYYVLHEICGFPNVRMYDGSWNEWSVLNAYEPVDATYIGYNSYTAWPAYPNATPSIIFFAGPNKYLEYKNGKFVDAYTGADASAGIKAGGPLGGNAKWDTLHRSEHIIFRPTSTLNAPYKTYNSTTDWFPITTYPAYSGSGNEIYNVDNAYRGATSTNSGGGATPYTPKGGGC